MAALKEQNKNLVERTSVLHPNVFGDVDTLRSKVLDQEKLLSQKQEPIITQVQAYKPAQVNPVEPIVKIIDKDKGKAIGVQINEPQVLPSKSTNPPMSKLDLELEKARKEKEDLAKELEKVENEAQATETRRKIQFIKSNSALASWPNLSLPSLTPALIYAPLVLIQGTSQVIPTLPSTINTQIPLGQPQQPQNFVLNQANVASTSNIAGFQK